MGCGFIGWCALQPAEQAAWVQAIFSVVGIFVAALLPLYIFSRERRDRIRDRSEVASEQSKAILNGSAKAAVAALPTLLELRTIARLQGIAVKQAAGQTGDYEDLSNLMYVRQLRRAEKLVVYAQWAEPSFALLLLDVAAWAGALADRTELGIGKQLMTSGRLQYAVDNGYPYRSLLFRARRILRKSLRECIRTAKSRKEIH